MISLTLASYLYLEYKQHIPKTIALGDQSPSSQETALKTQIAGSPVYTTDDTDTSLIRHRRVAVFGYGSQGHAHALNLRDSGVEVVVALPENSSSRDKARAQGLWVKSFTDAAAWADFIMFLVPDMAQRAVFEQIKKYLTPDKILAFAHGLNIHYGLITPPAGVDVVMIAPKGPGHVVRETYVDGQGVPMLVAVAQDASGQALPLALSYAHAIGGTRAGVIETTFREETETDLFGEQNVLCGGLVQLIHTGFEVLVEAGYSPAMAYFEVCHELKLIIDLVYREGIAGMLGSISDTAKWGCLSNGPLLIDESVRQRMKASLERIQTGEFVHVWVTEDADGRPNYSATLAAARHHPIEAVGAEMRALMPFIGAGRTKTTDVSGG